MLSRLGVLSGATRTSNMSISGVRCTKLEFYVEIVEIYNFRKIQRAILWGACGGDPGSIGALGSA